MLAHYPPVICTQVAGEFLFGQAHAQVSTAAFREARAFVESFEILRPDAGTAEAYGRLRATLTARGITLPDPNYWIAAHALENGLPLISTDTHFQHVAGLHLHLIPAR